MELIKPKIHSEYGKLKEIIVGSAKNAQIPTIKDKSLHCIDYAHLSDEEFKNIPTGSYPQKLLDETEEDLDNMANTLQSMGIKVHRPLDRDFSEPIKTDNWEVDGYYNYCPRDSMLVIGDKVISTPMTLRHRSNESETCKPLFDPNHWIDLPKPKLLDSMYDRSDLSRPTLMDGPEPVFDAANIIKSGFDILYLVSNTGNKAGAKFLQDYLINNFDDRYKVHKAENVYAYIHIDTTFVFLREGLVLCNPTRVNERNIPDFLRNWDIVWAPEPYPTQVLEDWCPASPWLGMNILSIDEKTVMVEEHQTLLMRVLKKHGIDSIPIKMRHSRTFSGGPHCVTLDVVRE
jgi:glycine amidinotransferase/scyllo-inosamine-4-phosphate amidinotransferase 1